jgi:hypothetical protein
MSILLIAIVGGFDPQKRPRNYHLSQSLKLLMSLSGLLGTKSLNAIECLIVIKKEKLVDVTSAS